MTADTRWVPYGRRDGWAKACAVNPDPAAPTGWVCPRCGRNATVFYGPEPRFDPATKRYVGPDNRVCARCVT